VKGEAATRCVNASCPAQIKEGVKHFASKAAFDIDGLGDKLVDQLVSRGLVTSYADIFHLEREHLKNLERMGDKSAENLVAAIQKSKQITFDRFLYALGIRFVGEHVASLLADQFQRLEQLMNVASKEREDVVETLQSIEGVGPVVAESVASFFNQSENIETIRRIIESGVEIIGRKAPAKDRLDGKVFVLTGSLEGLSRTEAKKQIEAAGGRVSGAVSRNTDYLVVGASPGSKLVKAKELGIQIIGEGTLKEMLDLN
jgi:DNA ligase (NAD+)